MASKMSRSTSLVLSVLFLSFLAFACATPDVTSVTRGPTPGGTITVTGTGFGTEVSLITVAIKKTSELVQPCGNVTVADGITITCDAPEGAGGPYHLTVTVDGVESNHIEWLYQTPVVEWATGAQVQGSLITIHGSNFGNDSSTLKFVQCYESLCTDPVVSVPHTEIQCIAPSRATIEAETSSLNLPIIIDVSGLSNYDNATDELYDANAAFAYIPTSCLAVSASTNFSVCNISAGYSVMPAYIAMNATSTIEDASIYKTIVSWAQGATEACSFAYATFLCSEQYNQCQNDSSTAQSLFCASLCDTLRTECPDVSDTFYQECLEASSQDTEHCTTVYGKVAQFYSSSSTGSSGSAVDSSSEADDTTHPPVGGYLKGGLIGAGFLVFIMGLILGMAMIMKKQDQR